MIPKVALVGVSGYGKVHLAELVRLAVAGRIEFRAAVVVNPQETAEQLLELCALGVTIYPTTAAMWRHESGRIDLACLPVGIAAHEPLTLEALRHGANVLLEKPAAGCIAAVDRMIAAREEAGKFVAVGFQLFYQPGTAAIQQLIAAGELGEIRRIAAIGIGPRDDSYYQRNRWAGRISDRGVPILDSPFSNAFAHYVHLALCWNAAGCGAAGTAWRGVRAVLRRARPDIEMFDNCAVSFRTAAGVQMDFGFSHTARTRVPQHIRVIGTRGTIDWNSDLPEWRLTRSDGIISHRGPISSAPTRMFEQVLQRLTHPRACICPLESAREHVQAVVFLQQQASIGQLPAAGYRILNHAGQYILNAPVEKTLSNFFDTGILPADF